MLSRVVVRTAGAMHHICHTTRGVYPFRGTPCGVANVVEPGRRDVATFRFRLLLHHTWSNVVAARVAAGALKVCSCSLRAQRFEHSASSTALRAQRFEHSASSTALRAQRFEHSASCTAPRAQRQTAVRIAPRAQRQTAVRIAPRAPSPLLARACGVMPATCFPEYIHLKSSTRF